MRSVKQDHCRKLYINKIIFFCSLESLISSEEMKLILTFHNKADPLHQTLLFIRACKTLMRLNKDFQSQNIVYFVLIFDQTLLSVNGKNYS